LIKTTIIDVAKEAGVSKSTVSRVIRGDITSVREDTRKRVQEAIRKTGYKQNALASGLRTKRTHTVLLMIPDIVNPFWPEVARGVQDALRKEGYAVVLANSDWDGTIETDFLHRARTHCFDGIVINPARVTDQQLLQIGIPTVILGLHEDFPSFDSVGNDTLAGVRLAMQHLYDLGHRKIGLISGQYASRGRSARLKQYLSFLSDQNLIIEENDIVHCPYGQHHGYEAAKRLINQNHPPSAIFASNDILAIGALQALHAAGVRVPQDLSLIGMDDIYPASVTTPPLTTIAKFKYEEGREAARMLIDRIDRQTSKHPKTITFAPQLIIRGSTKPSTKPY